MAKLLSTQITGTLSINGNTQPAYTFTFGGTGTPTTGTDKTPHLYVPVTVTASQIYLTCKTAPSGGAFAIDIQKSTDGTSWTSVGTASISSGNKYANTTVNAAIAGGNRLRFDITTVNGASDWTCQLSSYL